MRTKDIVRGVVKFTIEGFLLRTKDERDWEWMINFNYNNKMRKTTSAEAFDSTYTYTHPHTVLGKKWRNNPANNFDNCPYISNDLKTQLYVIYICFKIPIQCNNTIDVFMSVLISVICGIYFITIFVFSVGVARYYSKNSLL